MFKIYILFLILLILTNAKLYFQDFKELHKYVGAARDFASD